MAGESWPRRAGWMVVAIVVADWVTKFLITNRLAPYGQIELLGHWVYLARMSNAGVAFGTLDGSHGAWRTPLLIAVSCVGILALARVALTTCARAARLSLFLLLAGAIGNLGDRLANGAVTDFLVVRYFPYVFNVADVAITAGALGLGFDLLRRREPPSVPG